MDIYQKIGNIKTKQILLLQGPMGYFFDKLDKEFKTKGANTFRIGLNAGDEFFSSSSNYTPFTDKKEKFKYFIEEYYRKYLIDMIFVFGDCRYYQSIAINIAKKLGISVFVFEEGYIRPNYLTLEKNGVNANSSLPKDRAFYDKVKVDKLYEYKAINGKVNFLKLYLYSSIYFIISNIFKYKYPYYEHHRNFSVKREFFYGCRGLYRKLKYKFKEKNLEKKYMQNLSKKYFFVPLQTHGDFQIIRHSKYNSIEEFILEVLTSFSKYATNDDYLVFKHHPIDRGRCDYSSFIKKHAKLLKCDFKIDIVFDVHLPTLLKNAKGTIVINSTVGLSSIYHYTPTICMGKAIYDIKGLTSIDTSLDDFWFSQEEIDDKLLKKYRYWLVKNTQINDGFYWN